MRSALRILLGSLLGVTLVVASALASGPIRPHATTDALERKLDPRLLASLSTPESPVSVWVSFADKGERDPATLALMLARAESELSPRNRARRERAGVRPLVDYLDLPLHGPYVDALGARGFQPYGQSRWFNRVAVHVPAARLAELADLPFVERMMPVELGLRSPAPIEEAARPVNRVAPENCASCVSRATLYNYGSTTAMVTQIGVPAVHDSGYIGTGVLVAILDEGFNFHSKHEALRNTIIPPGFERDFVGGDTLASDTTNSSDYTHGTEVMGCIAGNKPGTYLGTAFGATFALARTEVHQTETAQEMVNWGMGAEWADSLGADLITSSLGYDVFEDGVGSYTFADMNGHTTIVTRAAEIAASKGILILNAAGNENGNSWNHIVAPADVNGDSLITVGAVNGAGNITSFSSRGPTADGRIKPDLCALGSSNPLVSPFGTVNGYTNASGTSFATPTLAGLAACLIGARPQFTPTQIIRALRETASQANAPDTLKGYGIPNGLAALRWGMPPVSVGPPPAVPLGLAILGPNPVSICDGGTAVRFALGAGAPASARARVDIIDAQGRRVRNLFSGPIAQGEYRVASWNGCDESGRSVGSGLYFVALEAGGHRKAARLVWLR